MQNKYNELMGENTRFTPKEVLDEQRNVKFVECKCVNNGEYENCVQNCGHDLYTDLNAVIDKYIDTHCTNYTEKEKVVARNAFYVGFDIGLNKNQLKK